MDITEEILQQFNQSWAATQNNFGDLIDDNPALSHLIPIYNYIPKLKKAGWVQHFRLGILHQDLIISRSIESTLKADQKFISVKATESSFIVTLKDKKRMYKQYTIKDLDDERFEELLQTLKEHLIS